MKMIKKINISGDAGYYQKQEKLLAIIGERVKVYNIDDSGAIMPIYKSKGIRYPACLCYGKLNRILWIATTENKVYGVRIDEKAPASEFQIERISGVADFEITSIGISDDEKWLYFSAVSSQGDMMFAYSIDNGNIVTLNIDTEISIPFPLIKYRRGYILAFKCSNMSFDYRDESLLKKELSSHSLDGDLDIRLEIVKVNPYWNREFRSLLQISDDGRYFLCEKKGNRGNRMMIIDAEKEQVLSGDMIPEAVFGCYDTDRNRFIAANCNEIFSLSLQNQTVKVQSLFKFKRDMIRNIVLADNHLLVLMDENSYLLDI